MGPALPLPVRSYALLGTCMRNMCTIVHHLRECVAKYNYSVILAQATAVVSTHDFTVYMIRGVGAATTATAMAVPFFTQQRPLKKHGSNR